jgi:hypothetical protein
MHVWRSDGVDRPLRSCVAMRYQILLQHQKNELTNQKPDICRRTVCRHHAQDTQCAAEFVYVGTGLVLINEMPAETKNNVQ